MRCGSHLRVVLDHLLTLSVSKNAQFDGNNLLGYQLELADQGLAFVEMLAQSYEYQQQRMLEKFAKQTSPLEVLVPT